MYMAQCHTFSVRAAKESEQSDKSVIKHRARFYRLRIYLISLILGHRAMYIRIIRQIRNQIQGPLLLITDLSDFSDSWPRAAPLPSPNNQITK